MSRVLVLGAGQSGRAAEALLKSQGFDVLVLDGKDAFPRGDRDVASPAGGAQGAAATGMSPPRAGGAAEVGAATFLSPQGDEFDFAVVSPGIALTHPWIVEALQRRIPLKSELQLGCEELKRRGWKLLAVTGSKGKSSVVKVVAEALGGMPCGNYGLPVCEVALGSGGASGAAATGMAPPRAGGASGAAATGMSPPRAGGPAEVGAATFLSPLEPERWAVVEVSSFMLETTTLPPDTFEAAAILNLQEDHLDRHGSVEVYHGLKRKLLTFAKKGLGPAATGMSPPRAGGVAEVGTQPSASETAEVRTFLSPLPWKNSYFDNEILAGNAAVAAELMRVAGLDDAKIAAAFRRFKPLPHRMNLVAEIGGVRYIDDSKATSLAALVAGVKMASVGNRTIEQSDNRTIRLIAGGLPKGDDPKTARAVLTERVKKVYLIGQSADEFFAAWKGAVDCEICGTMDKTVERAMREAEKGETVLLSPGTASFDQFQSYGERGDVFARLVKKEGQPK